MKLIAKEDNTATIKVAEAGYSPKLRHVHRTHNVHIGALKDVKDKKIADFDHIGSDEQAADIFTKALAPQKWPNALNLLGIVPADESSETPIPKLSKDSTVPIAPAHVVPPTGNQTNVVDQLIKDVYTELAEISTPETRLQDARRATEEYAGLIRALPAATKLRPSGHSKGWGRLFEICTDKNSSLGYAADQFDKVTVIRVTEEHDFSDPITVHQIADQLIAFPGSSIHGSLPCTPWSSYQ